MCRKAVLDAILELEKRGFVQRDRRAGVRQNNIYRVKLDGIENGSTGNDTTEKGSTEKAPLVVSNPAHKQLKNSEYKKPHKKLMELY